MICKGCGDPFKKWNTRAKIAYCTTCDILFKKKYFKFPELNYSQAVICFYRWSKSKSKEYSLSRFEGQENYSVCAKCDYPLQLGESYIRFPFPIKNGPGEPILGYVAHGRCFKIISKKIKPTYPNSSLLLNKAVESPWINRWF